MNLTELNNEFKVLFEDLATSGSKGLDDYERSLCFTYSQEDISRQLASSGVLDPISTLVKNSEETALLTSIYDTAKDVAKVSDPFFVLGYFVKSNTVENSDVGATPVSMAFINGSILSGPYKYPPKNLAYVVMGETNITVFPPFNYDLKSLVTRYVEKPTPVILTSLTGGDTIDGLSTPTAPVIAASYHTELVKRAVEFAVKTYIGQPEQEVNGGQRNK